MVRTLIALLVWVIGLFWALNADEVVSARFLLFSFFLAFPVIPWAKIFSKKKVSTHRYLLYDHVLFFITSALLGYIILFVLTF